MVGKPGKFDNLQKGAGSYTLCASCNSLTGTWYGPAYIEMASQGIEYFRIEETSGAIALPYKIFPLRVMKQIVSMFASKSGPNLFENTPYLRKFVFDRDCKGLPKDMAVSLYMLDRSAHKSTGIAATMNIFTGERFIGNEMAHPPFGLVLSLDTEFNYNRELCTFQDISFFSEYGYDEYTRLFLKIPRKPGNPMMLDYREGLPMPGDFLKSL